MYKYEMDPVSIVEDTEQHLSIHRQMDRRTRWNQSNFIEVGVYKNSIWVIAFKCVVLLNI